VCQQSKGEKAGWATQRNAGLGITKIGRNNACRALFVQVSLLPWVIAMQPWQ
jgi:hypothetical protein